MTAYYKLEEHTYDLFAPMMTQEAKDLFLTTADVVGIGAVENDVAVGVMLLIVYESRMDITYIMVAEEVRRQGIGTGLLSFATKLCEKNNLMLTASFLASDDDLSMYSFFNHTGVFSVIEKGTGRWEISKEAIEAFLKKGMKATLPATLFFAQPEDAREKFVSKLRENNEIFIDPFQGSYIAPLCLTCDKKGKQVGLLLCKPSESEGEEVIPELSFLWCDAEEPGAVGSLLVSGAEAFMAKGYEKLRVTTVTEQTEQMVTKHFDGAKSLGRFYMASWDYEPV